MKESIIRKCCTKTQKTIRAAFLYNENIEWKYTKRTRGVVRETD